MTVRSTSSVRSMHAKHGSARIYVNVVMHYVVVFSDNAGLPAPRCGPCHTSSISLPYGGRRAKKEMVSELSVRVLQYLDGHDAVDTLHLAGLFKVDHQKIVGAVKSLQAVGDVSVAGPVHNV